MTQQNLSAAEQAANQVAASTQMQLQMQSAIQNAQAANSNSSGGWEMALAQHLYSNQDSFLDRAALDVIYAASSQTASSVVNFTSSLAQSADSINTMAYMIEGLTHQDLVTGAYVSTMQANIGIAASMLGMFGGDLLELGLPVARAVGSSIVNGIGANLGSLGLFGSGLSVNINSVLSEAEDVENFIIPDNRAAHIFRDAPGHIADTDENRQLLQSVVENPGTLLGSDKFGNIWSAQLNLDGTQTWVQVRNDQIINGGINLVPHEFNPETGLSNPLSTRY